ncbi:uncharacterized protein LOC125762223 [Anopheles funestus]|uniref:uncharacterized protein LOC125762223 n=1 Tax=Anopheles funestus TaxID=62324 RepID=UPI0020C68DDF|nr:uncharacterized protein LOC125762223 [Anopheles funestus]
MACNPNDRQFSERHDQLERELDQMIEEEWRILGPTLYEDGGAESFPWPLRHFDTAASNTINVGGGNIDSNSLIHGDGNVSGVTFNNTNTVSGNVDINSSISVEEVEFRVHNSFEDLNEGFNCDDTRSSEGHDKYSNLGGFKSFQEALKFFFVVSHLSRENSNLLLAILRKFLRLDLPKDYRTIMKTPASVRNQIVTISAGSLWYQGVETVLKNYFKEVEPEVSHFSLQVSVDGLPLFKSSANQFWPVLIKVVELPNAPVMPVAIFCGKKKPDSVEEFLRPFVDEMNSLIESGMNLGEKLITFSISAFIADSPARSFIKAVMGCNALHGCTKCTVVGTKVEGRVIFESVDALVRTDAGFRLREDPQHHKDPRSPLENIRNINMISHFPVSDRLHLLELGCTRKILKGLLEHIFENFYRWSPQQKRSINAYVISVKLPSELHRAYRSLYNLAFWKGTEYRTFLHYISLIIYKDFMYEAAYKHYLLYFSAITIFSSLAHKKYWPIGKRFLNKFVLDFHVHYGRSNLVSNVHNLIHIYDEVLVNGPLDSFSSYPFENHLQFLKKCIKSGTKCLEQAAGRLYEYGAVHTLETSVPKTYPWIKVDGSTVHVTDSFLLSPNVKDQWFLTKNYGIVKFLSAYKNEVHSIVLVGMQYSSMKELFNIEMMDDTGILEMSSAALGMFKVDSSTLSVRVEVPIRLVKCKLVMVPLPSRSLSLFPLNRDPSDACAYIPLLHTFQP